MSQLDFFRCQSVLGAVDDHQFHYRTLPVWMESWLEIGEPVTFRCIDGSANEIVDHRTDLRASAEAILRDHAAYSSCIFPKSRGTDYPAPGFVGGHQLRLDVICNKKRHLMTIGNATFDLSSPDCLYPIQDWIIDHDTFTKFLTSESRFWLLERGFGEVQKSHFRTGSFMVLAVERAAHPIVQTFLLRNIICDDKVADIVQATGLTDVRQIGRCYEFDFGLGPNLEIDDEETYRLGREAFVAVQAKIPDYSFR